MSTEFERLLRDTVHDLAGGGRPVDLSGPALRTARRIRTRRRISATAAVLVLLVGLGFGATQVASFDTNVPPATDNSTSPAPTAAPSASTSTDAGMAPVVVPGGWLIRVAPASAGAIMYDERLGRYRLLSTRDRVLPSPNGQYLATVGPTELKITRTSDERQLAARNTVSADAVPVWSPDSSRLAYVMSSADGLRVAVVNLNDTNVTSDATVRCTGGCTLKWLDTGQRVRVYAGSTRVEVDAATGSLGAASATPDDPCGARVVGYRIDNESWLCVTASGFAVTTRAGTVTTRDPFPTAIGDWTVEGDIDRYVLFRPK